MSRNNLPVIHCNNCGKEHRVYTKGMRRLKPPIQCRSCHIYFRLPQDFVWTSLGTYQYNENMKLGAKKPEPTMDEVNNEDEDTKTRSNKQFAADFAKELGY